MKASDAFRKQLEGYGVTTAQILYRMPDYHSVFQEFIWQQYDLYPEFPELRKFLAFWEKEIEGPLHSVTIAHNRLIKPAEIRQVNCEFLLN
jgi:uncharacterized protein Usg